MCVSVRICFARVRFVLACLTNHFCTQNEFPISIASLSIWSQRYVYVYMYVHVCVCVCVSVCLHAMVHAVVFLACVYVSVRTIARVRAFVLVT